MKMLNEGDVMIEKDFKMIIANMKKEIISTQKIKFMGIILLSRFLLNLN